MLLFLTTNHWYLNAWFNFNDFGHGFSSFLLGNEYNYKKGDSKGPENWGNLKPEWKLCGNGKLQSPIDILNKRVQELPQLGKLEKDYKLGPAFLKNRFNDVMVSH